MSYLNEQYNDSKWIDSPIYEYQQGQFFLECEQSSDHYSDIHIPNAHTLTRTRTRTHINNTLGKQQKSLLIENRSQYDSQLGSPIGWTLDSLSPPNILTQFEVQEQYSYQFCKPGTTNCLSCEEKPGSTHCKSCEQQPHCLSCQEKSFPIQQIQKKKIRKHQVEKSLETNVYFSIRKNFPKLIGTHLLKQIEQFPDFNIPEGIQQFVDDAVKRKQAKLQQSFAIEDFRRICLTSEESKQYFIDFILNKFIVHLMHSAKFTQIDLVLDLIRNAYVGACNPEQWKGNMQIGQP